jgi:hypothetical protein
MPSRGSENTHAQDPNVEDDEMTMEVISVHVLYDAGSRTMTILPLMALSSGVTYHVHFSGVKLSNGKSVARGTDAVQFEFTVAHVHETGRITYDQSSGLEIAYEKTEYSVNKPTYKEFYISSGGDRQLVKTRYYDTTLTTGENVEWYDVMSSGLMTNYPRKVDTYGGLIFAEYVSNDGYQFRVSNWWSDEARHGIHRVARHYVAPLGMQQTGIPLDVNDPTSGFELKHVSLLEMNHDLDLPANGIYPHRHIFYTDLGVDGEIDVDSRGNPAPHNDVISVWHTREYQNGQRKYDWTWVGNVDEAGNVTGIDVKFSESDLASRVRIYEYDEQHRRTRRTSYFDGQGKTRRQWLDLMSSGDVNNYLDSWREYGYDDLTGNQSEIFIINKCQLRDEQNHPMTCPGYLQKPGFFLQQKRVFGAG